MQMGADGPGLFSDDVAMDVRDAYREAIADGTTDEVAEARILEEFADALEDEDDGPVVWLALAFTESKLGRLSALARDRALDVIDSGTNLARWQEAGDRAVQRRAAALDKVRTQLTGPQPARKKVRRPKKDVSDLAPGQVLGYRSRTGRLFLMVVDGMVDTDYYYSPIVRYLNYVESRTPAEAELEEILERPLNRAVWRDAEILVIERSAKEREQHGVFPVGQVPRPDTETRADHPGSSSGWTFVTSYLEGCDRTLGPPDD
jgi:hypothetical protein